MATVMLLLSFEGLSDAEACDRLAFDLRWQAAAGLGAACRSFHPTVLVGMRNRLRASVRPRRLFEDTVAIAKRAGVVSRKVRVLDSTQRRGRSHRASPYRPLLMGRRDPVAGGGLAFEVPSSGRPVLREQRSPRISQGLRTSRDQGLRHYS